MSKKFIAGFWSYVHSDNEHENGRINRLRERLERSIRFFSGIREFRIFLDRKDIGWGENWARRISESIDDALLIFPIVTPSYFSSTACQEEILAFHKREIKANRDDLILPIYYLETEFISDEASSDDDVEREVQNILRSAQYEDWRSLRQTEETDPSYAQAVERLAQQATKAIKRGIPAEKVNRQQENKSETFPFQAQDSSSTVVAKATDSEPTSSSSFTPGHILTLTVSQMPGRAQFTTISEAIARAPGGARILVSPGHYRERIIIEKPLELVGSGAIEDIVVQSDSGQTLVFDTNIGIVRNLTLRQNAKDSRCVWIKQGRLELEDCNISSAGGACVAVSDNADPRVRRNQIHGGKRSGLHIDSARGTYEDNEISRNLLSGIQVRGSADPIVRRNRVFDSVQGGIFVFEGARGTYEDNEVFGNGYAGFLVAENANPIVRRNRIYDGKQGGVYVYDKGQGRFEDNEIFGNTNSGIHARDGAEPIVRRNRIFDGKQSGIYVTSNGGGTYESNEIYGNQNSGIQITSGGNPIVRRNRVFGGKQSGISITEGGLGAFDDNEVFENNYAGVKVSSEGSPTFRRNRINRNGYEGIWVTEQGSGTFVGNDLRENQRGPTDIHKSAESRVTLKDNQEK